MKKILIIVTVLVLLLVSCKEDVTSTNQADDDLWREFGLLKKDQKKLEETIESYKLENEALKVEMDDLKVKLEDQKVTNEKLNNKLTSLNVDLREALNFKTIVNFYERYFLEEIESERMIAYVKYYDPETNVIGVDEIEWVTIDDTERIKELNINVKRDMPNNYYMHNASKEIVEIQLDPLTALYRMDWEGEYYMKQVSNEDFYSLEDGSLLVNILWVNDNIYQVNEMLVR